ncbi:MAG: DUF4331 family protein, partial [Dehalococcoidia bacterium]|nr:DUF4331 family protein [Dehalococcoidia bacterium]
AGYQATAQGTVEALRMAVDGAFGSPQDGGPLGDLTPEDVAGALIPDVVTIDFSQPVAFPNGRQLEDDVINAALGIVLNRGGAAGISDAIDANDVAFGSTFPYLAPPHAGAAPPAEATNTPAQPVAPPPAGSGFASGDDASLLLWIVLGTAVAAVATLGVGLYLRKVRA